MDDAQQNPFDDESLTFLVLVNSQGQHSLWPTFAQEPRGWRRLFGPSERSACLKFVDEHWIDMRPGSLRDAS
ncbi:MbtH family protein [Methylocystis sp. B8]|uniref:MbtH family protein n=1 Tax=Methylocystis sp. B8 TaxID=544938 RepID=UPI0010FE7AEB|nr:MbtH family protein [Methylocystis sp. B8]TLG75095.1 MbtH family protein [Methylocystis sp. B8]